MLFLFWAEIKGAVDRLSEGFQSGSDSGNSAAFQTQLASLSQTYDPISNKHQDVNALLQNSSTQMPANEQCLVNFFCLGCRFTGYMGPFNNGFFDANEAVRYACKAGCRTFVLEIDYADDCSDSNGEPTYFPKLVVRDSQGKSVVNTSGYQPTCNSLTHSNIRDVCTSINSHAFAHGNPAANDPVIVVLYLLRMPPKTKGAPKLYLNYMSDIAKCIEPLVQRHVDNVVSGGTFTRQKQEGKLLTNPITDYQGRILIFSNADTTAFRNETTYAPNEDLDYLVNLRLTYMQTKLGSTGTAKGGAFGLVETAETYLIIPPDQIESIASSTKLQWTLCLSADPAVPVSETTYNAITSEFGVHCVPIQLWDKNNGFMFTDDTFGTYSFVPKPEALRFVQPPIAVPAEPSTQTDAKGGALRPPVVASAATASSGPGSN